MSLDDGGYIWRVMSAGFVFTAKIDTNSEGNTLTIIRSTPSCLLGNPTGRFSWKSPLPNIGAAESRSITCVVFVGHAANDEKLPALLWNNTGLSRLAAVSRLAAASHVRAVLDATSRTSHQGHIQRGTSSVQGQRAHPKSTLAQQAGRTGWTVASE